MTESPEPLEGRSRVAFQGNLPWALRYGGDRGWSPAERTQQGREGTSPPASHAWGLPGLMSEEGDV